MAVIGGRYMKTSPTLDGSSPFRICTVTVATTLSQTSAG